MAVQRHQDYRQAALAEIPQKDLWALTYAYLDSFGFDAAYWVDQTSSGLQLHSNIDADWVRYAEDQGLLHADPFFKHCFNSHDMLPTGIDHLPLYPHLNRDEVAFIRAAGEAGSRAGVSIPVRLPQDGRGLAGWHILSSVGADAVRGVWGRDLDELRVSMLTLHHRLIAPLSALDGGLSARERDCLMWCAEGARNTAIAERLGISESTVEFHMRNLRKKLGARTREHAVALAIRHGIV